MKRWPALCSDPRAVWFIATMALTLLIFLQSGQRAAEVQDRPLNLVFGEGYTQRNQEWNQFGHTLGHLGLYALLSFCVFQAAGCRSIRGVALVTVAAFVYGVSDELHQSLVPARNASISDLALDWLGALTGASAGFLSVRILSPVVRQGLSRIRS